MTRLDVGAVTLVWAVVATAPMVAQSPSVEVQTVGCLHTVVFRTAQGNIGVSIAADASPGDTISGVLRAEPAGSSPPEQQKNLGELNGLVVGGVGQGVPVSDRRYAWAIPATLRTGRVLVALSTRDGRILAQAAVPIDGVPAPTVPRPSGRGTFELPADVQTGLPAVIRGPFDGMLAAKRVRIGDANADLLAASQRRLVFRVPTDQVGEVPLRLTSGANGVEGTVRVFKVEVSATSLEFQRGQKATMTARISGLLGIAAPVTMTLRNSSSDVVSVEGGDVQTITIEPRHVAPDGIVMQTFGLTGVRPGALHVVVAVAGRPLSLFDVPLAAGRVLTTWEAATGIRITPDARDLIQQSVRDAGGPLEQFLARQQANLGDPRDVFAALLSNYCFDLRDENPRGAPRATRNAEPARIQRVAFVQAPGRGAGVEIDASDVRRLSFRDSLTRLVERFSGSQPVGYLLITSMPASAGITIDGQRKSEMTNRRFVTSVGEHAVVIAGAAKTCQQRVQVAAFQISVVACAP